ncbi:MAG: hypothetical protein A2Y17_11040 [Clostridiales bacterium GWF2_38_85]|nr:MAG: hypothetical protein A2Y17_11040 [Clostridiales bacterium GWF2_38_85]HBL84662.1 VOC family protein [Clostridiales bacterium]
MKLGATLYIKNSFEAVERYKEAFGLTLGYHVIHDEEEIGQHFFHASLMCGEEEIFAVSEFGNYLEDRHLAEITLSRHNTELGLGLGSEEAVKKAFSVLSEGGMVISPVGSAPWNACVAQVVDKYGIGWCICI